MHELRRARVLLLQGLSAECLEGTQEDLRTQVHGRRAGGGGGPSRPWGLFSSFESMVQNFISFGVDINMVAPGSNVTLLSVASEEGSEEAVHALIAAGADVNMASICEMGFMPLHIAADRGSSGLMLRRFIAAGADVNKANKFGVTPMRMAAQNGHEAVIRALVAAGAVEDEKTKAERHRNAMGQLLQRMIPQSRAMPRAKGSTLSTLARESGSIWDWNRWSGLDDEVAEGPIGREGVNVRVLRVGLKYPTTSPSPPSARRLCATPQLLAWDLDRSPAEASISAATSCCFISDSPRAATAAFSRTRPSPSAASRRSLSASRDDVAMLVNDANAGDASVGAAAAAAAPRRSSRILAASSFALASAARSCALSLRSESVACFADFRPSARRALRFSASRAAPSPPPP